MDRIGILIELAGKDAVIGSLKQIKQLAEDIKRDKISLKIEAYNISKELGSIRSQIKSLENEKIRLGYDPLALKAVDNDIAKVKQSIKSLKDTNKDLKLQIGQIDTGASAQRIKEIRDSLRELYTELHKVQNGELLRGDLDKAGSIRAIRRDINALDTELNKLTSGTRRIEIKSEIEKNLRDIRELEKQLDALQAKRIEILNSGDAKAIEEIDKQIEELTKHAEELKNRLGEIKLDEGLDSTILSELSSEMRDAEESAMSLQEALEGLADALNTIGDVFGGIAGIGSSVGNMFGDIAGMFQGGLLDTVTDTLAQNATNAVTSRLGDIVSRYDTMKTFVPYMELAGATAEESNEALSKIDQSIRGLPIGLNESALRFRRYYMFLEDVTTAQNLVIGLQKAVTAGGANQQMKTMAYYQIDRLLATGKLTTSRQWQSLINGLGVSAKYLKEAMGYVDMTNDEFFTMLSSKDFNTMEVIEGLASLADETTSAGAKLEAATQLYKSTLESWLSNINYAITRGGETVTKALNELSQEVFGVDLTGLAKAFRDKIDSVFKAIDSYIESRPELFGNLAESIARLFGWVEGFDWESLADKVLTNLADVIDTIADVLERLPKDALEDFIAFALTWASPLSKAMLAISEGLPIMLAVFEKLKDFDWASFAGKVMDHIEKMFERISTLLDLLPDGMVEDLLVFALVDAPIYARFFNALGSIVGTLAKIAIPVGVIAKFGGITKLLGGLSKALPSFKSIAKGFASTGMLIATIAAIGAVIYEFAKIIEYINEMPPITPGFGTKLTAIATMVGTIGIIAGGVSTLLSSVDLASFAAGELLTAGIIGLTAFVGIVIEQYTDIVDQISRLNVGAGYKAKLDAVVDMIKTTSVIVGLLTGGTAAITGLSGGVGGLAILIGETLTAGIIGTIKYALSAIQDVVDIVNDISGMDTSNLDANLKKLKEATKGIVDTFTDDTFSDTKQLTNVATNIEKLSESLLEIGRSLEELQGFDDIDINFAKVSNQMVGIVKIAKAVGEELGRGYQLDSTNTGNFALIATNMKTVIEEVGKSVTLLRDMKADLDNLGITLDSNGNYSKNGYFANFVERFMTVMDFITGENGIYAKLREMSGAISVDNKWRSSDYSDIVTNMKTIIGTLHEVITELDVIGEEMLDSKIQIQDGKFTGWFGNTLDGLNSIIEYVKQMYTSMTELFGGDEYGGDAVVVTENMDTMVKNFETIFVDIKEMVKKLTNLAWYIDNLSYNGKGNAVFKFGVLKSQMDGIWGELSAVIDSMVGSGGWFWSVFKKWEAANNQDIISNINQMFTDINGIFDNLDSLSVKVDATSPEEVARIGTMIDEIIQPIRDMVSAIDDMAFEVNQVGGANDLATIMGDVSTTFEYVGGLISTLNRMAGRIDSLDSDDIGGKLTTLLLSIKSAFTNIPTDTGELLDRAQEYKNAVDKVFEIISTLETQAESIGVVNENETAKTFGSIINQIVEGFTGDTDVTSLVEVVSSLSSIINQLTGALTALAGTDLQSLIAQMGETRDAADDMNGILDNTIDALKRIQRTSSEASNALKLLQSNADGVAFDGLRYQLSALAISLSSAARQAYSLSSAINAIPTTKTVTVNYQQTGGIAAASRSISTASARVRGYTLAQGGTVYASTGFQKRGTDVVPAMLTPGEFVLRKAAVDKIGLGFLRRLNSLNIDGALNALYSARRIPQGISNVINNSRSYDNHAVVNMNITNGSQGYSQRRAYRYLRTV